MDGWSNRSINEPFYDIFISDQVEVLFDDGVKYTAPISDVRKRVSFILRQVILLIVSDTILEDSSIYSN